ncbi:MAG TPA: hypothetical protein VM370_06975 [Candidatus Thermoplasmatota archaeon]|nr:hypothetical protein [Candidatus Thermoplasmatota archaeon]
MEEDLNTKQEQQNTNTQNDRTFKETFKSGSPDQVHDKVKDVVQKGVAAVAGALKGFNDKTQEHDIAGSTKSAIRTAGDTARTTIAGVTEEAKNLKEPLMEAGQKLKETAKDLSSAARSQVQDTKEAVKGGSGASGSSLGASSGGSMGAMSGSSYNEGSLYNEGSSLGGSELGSGVTGMGQGTSAAGSEFPDISSTPLAQSDKKLQGKDLTEDLDE